MNRDGHSTALLVAGVALGALAGAMLATRKQPVDAETPRDLAEEEWGPVFATAEMIAKMPKVDLFFLNDNLRRACIC
jgi:hypothetical protein